MPVPNALAAPTLASSTFDSLTVSWTDTQTTTAYFIRWRVTGQPWSGPVEVLASLRQHTIKGLVPAQVHQVEVAAENADGLSAWSPTALLSTTSLPNLDSLIVDKAATIAELQIEQVVANYSDRDYDLSDDPLLPWLAEGVRSPIWPGAAGSVELRRAAVSYGLRIARAADTPHAFDLWGEAGGFVIRVVVISRSTVDLYANIPFGQEADLSWSEYILRSAELLLRTGRTVSNLYFADSFQATVYPIPVVSSHQFFPGNMPGLS